MSKFPQGERKIASEVINYQALEAKLEDFLKGYKRYLDDVGDELTVINVSNLSDFLNIFYEYYKISRLIDMINTKYIFNFEINISKFINMATLLFNKLKHLTENENFLKHSIIIPQIFCVFPCMEKIKYRGQVEPVNLDSLLGINQIVLPKFLKKYNTLNIENYLINSRIPKEKHQIMDLLEGDRFDIYDLAVIDNPNNLTRTKLLENLNEPSYNNDVILRGNYITNILFNDDKDISRTLASSLFNHINKGKNVYVISLQSRNSITGLGREIDHNIKGYDDLFILDQLGSEKVINIYTHDTRIVRESILDDNSSMDVLIGNVYEVTIFKLINNVVLTYDHNSNINHFYKISEYNKTTYLQNTPTDKIITLTRKKVIDLTDYRRVDIVDKIASVFKSNQLYHGTVVSSKKSRGGNEFCRVKFINNNNIYFVNVFCNNRINNNIKFKLSYSKNRKPNFSIVNEASEKYDRYKYLKYKNKYLKYKKKYLQLKKMLL